MVDGDQQESDVEAEPIRAVGADGAVECRTRQEHTVSGVFNPSTGKVEWRDKYEGAVAGVYNPATHQVEWRDKYEGGVDGAYDAATSRVQWASKTEGGAACVARVAKLPTSSRSTYLYIRRFHFP